MGEFEHAVNTLEDLKRDVEQSGGLKTYDMEVLRDISGFKKLGIHVRPLISKQLLGAGLGHVPQNLPEYQDRPVRVYKLGTPVAEIINAAVTPGLSEDETLRRATGGGSDADAVLMKIRELVGIE